MFCRFYPLWLLEFDSFDVDRNERLLLDVAKIEEDLFRSIVAFGRQLGGRL